MSSDDIANLYQQFGGKADGYRELGRDNVVRQSRERWPLLSQVRQQDEAQRAARAGAAVHAQPAVFENEAGLPAQAVPRQPVSAEGAAPAPLAPLSPPTFPPAAPAAHEAPPAMPAYVRPAPAAARYVPAPAPAADRPAAGGTELQGLFARIAQAPQAAPAAGDPDVSLLRKLLRP